MSTDTVTTRLVKIVVASPGDVQVERDLVDRVVSEINRTTARSHGMTLELLRWETDSSSGLHALGPQGLIDAELQIERADLVIGILWRRLGTPTIGLGSGTEHELRVAWRAWRRKRKPQVMVYRCTREPPADDDAAEHERLQRFLDEVPPEQFVWAYGTTADFETLVRRHLSKRVIELAGGPAPPRRRRWALAFATAAVAALSVAVALRGGDRVPCTNEPVLAGHPNTVGVISRVGSNGCSVTETETAEGRVRGLGPEHELWLLVHIGGFYPDGPIPVDATGAWTAAVRFGGPGVFGLRLVAAGPAAIRRFREYAEHGSTTGEYAAIPAGELPKDAQTLSTLSGLRRDA